MEPKASDAASAQMAAGNKVMIHPPAGVSCPLVEVHVSSGQLGILLHSPIFISLIEKSGPGRACPPAEARLHPMPRIGLVPASIVRGSSYAITDPVSVSVLLP